MAFWNRSKNGVSNKQRLMALELATDEDFSLDEVVQRFGDLDIARSVVEDLRERNMVEFFWKRPKGGRDPISPAQIDRLLEEDAEWIRQKSFTQPYVIMVANDRGWRWHQRHWKSDS